MKCSPCIYNFLEEITGLSYSVVFCYFFSLITVEGFLIPACYSLELCIQMNISFLFSFVFSIGLICPDAIRQGPRARSYIKILLPICKETPDSCFIRDFQGKTSLRKMAEVLMACPGQVPMEGSKCTTIEGTVKMYIFWFIMQKFDYVYL